MYTVEECVDIIKLYMQCNNSLRNTRALFSAKYPERPIPSISTIQKIIMRFNTKGCLVPSHHIRNRVNRVLTEDMELDILCYVQENPNLSTAMVAKHFNISETSARKAIKKKICINRTNNPTEMNHSVNAHMLMDKSLLEQNVEMISELEELNIIKEELTQEVVRLHGLLEAEKGKVTGLMKKHRNRSRDCIIQGIKVKRK